MSNMFKQSITLFAGILLGAGVAFSQNDDPVLFTVQNTPVHVSEFRYIYSKTNQDKADFSQASLEEYLNLYINFKLKVQKARDLQLDTIPDTKSELEGYRRQLANSYLVDKEVTEKLVQETYQHLTQDVDISYILVNLDRAAPAADTAAAYGRAMRLLDLLRAGTPFDRLAADSSDDRSARDNQGRLGYVTAMFPDGFYEMEKAVYNAKPGSIVGPVRSPSGYNLIQVHSFRPARGEVEVGHILARKGEAPEKAAAAKMKIDSAYAALQAGMSWEEACKQFSEDGGTAAKSGYIGFFGINRYQKNFEDAAFGLKNDGDYSEPVETAVGWHIIRRVSRRPISSFDDMKRPLAERVKRDSRNEIAKQAMIGRIKKEAGFQENTQLLNNWIATQEDTVFHTFRWKPNPDAPQDVLLRFGSGKTYTLADFEQYCSRAGRERMRGKGFPVEETANNLYKAWSEDCAMQYEETQLEKKYPEFRSLMREYEEGIMLFEAAKRLVWDRANTDSTGLEAYYNTTLKGKYKWDERARVGFYTVKSDNPKVWKKVYDMAAKKSAAEVLKKFNKKADNAVVAFLEKTYEKGKNKELENLWRNGAMSEPKTDAGTKTTSFLKVQEMMPPGPKELNEARGYAVADYQDYLEKRWVEDLRKEYKVTLNQPVFDALVKK